jgi:[acyl-carrier-protein] S-malonyltransferase
MTQGNLALVFPGQGCQFVGMGADLAEAYPEARALYRRADEVLGLSLSGLCFQGPDVELNDTANTQPAIYVSSMALWQALAPRLGQVLPRVGFVAGHSLGEFVALAVAGAFSFEDGLRLVRCRGEAMRDAGVASPGGMAAIIGLEDQALSEVLMGANAGGKQGVWVANDNSPGQVVIAGEKAALERAMNLAKERRAKRVLPLAVSVACHTPLMGAAAERLDEALRNTPFQKPWALVVSNALAQPLGEPAAIQAALMKQLTSPVRWVESVRAMASAGARTMLEVGPKSVVAGLIKRIDATINVMAVSDRASLEAMDTGALG